MSSTYDGLREYFVCKFVRFILFLFICLSYYEGYNSRNRDGKKKYIYLCNFIILSAYV
jgi:hypothetical protein